MTIAFEDVYLCGGSGDGVFWGGLAISMLTVNNVHVLASSISFFNTRSPISPYAGSCATNSYCHSEQKTSIKYE